MDNDQINQQPLIPGEATVDVKLAGQYDRFFWSASVLNLLDKHYYDYAIASGGIAGGPFFPPGLPPTIGLFSAFPLWRAGLFCFRQARHSRQVEVLSHSGCHSTGTSS